MKISQLQPLNLVEEKEKFFADFSYNPQFRYGVEIDPVELEGWGNANESLESLAVSMLEHIPRLQGAPKASQEFIQRQFAQFAISIPQMSFKIVFDESQFVRCFYENQILHVRIPIGYKEDEVQGMLYHELGTHALRIWNHQRQPWGGQEFRDSDFRDTEEGLAVLNAMIVSPPSRWRRSALSYLAVAQAQRMSFSELFSYMNQFVSEKNAWHWSVRAKRGLTDTSKKGGLTKDFSYLRGVVSVFKWLQNEENNPHDLYLGRIGLEYISNYKTQSVQPIIPHFLNDIDEYRKKVAATCAILNLEQYV